MKKLLCVLVALVACLMLATVASAEATVPTTCQACNQEVTDWQVAPSDWATLAGGHYHFYLDKNVSYYWLTPGKTSGDTTKAVTICLDLNGFNNIKGGRVLGVYNGHTVNIMDSSADQTGYMEGKKGTNNPTGGAIFNLGTLNLYSGSLKFNTAGATDHKTYQGGVIAQYDYSSAVFNMYGGRVEGGQLVASDKGSSAGAAIYASSGNLNLYGGEITAGKTATGVMSCIYITKGENAACVTLSGDVNVDEVKTNSSSSYLSIDGTYSGRTRFAYASGFTLKAGKKVGNATNNPQITGELFCTTGWLVKLVGSELQLATYTPSGEWHECDHCNEVRRWTKLTSSNTNTPYDTAGEYHYYVSAATSITKQVRTKTGSSVCLDLYGNTLSATGRGMLTSGTSTINLMDTKGDGVLHCTGGNNNTQGLAAWVTDNATINMYGGTIRYTDTKDMTSRYGTVAVAGVFNMYGGTIEGADLKTLHSGSYAGAMQVFKSGKANLYGGTITAGSVGKQSHCVEISTDTATIKLAGSVNVENIYFTSNSKKLIVSGEYTGTSVVTFAEEVALGDVVGTSDNAIITGSLTCTNNDMTIEAEDGALVLSLNATATVTTPEGVQGFDTLQAAIDACETGTIQLVRSTTENVTVAKALELDLNGKTVNGTVTVAEGATLYVKDCQTDDYTIEDPLGYGKLTVTGSVEAQPGYLMITEEGAVSFHKYEVDIYAMSLRSEKSGLYYKSSFLGDELVAANVESFGVALSTREIPDEKNMASACKYTTFTGFESGINGNASTSTLVYGILKDRNSDAINRRNIGMAIYGRPYLKTADGYIFGDHVSRNFTEQLDGVDKQLSSLTNEQTNALFNMYDAFRSVLSQLALPNIVAKEQSNNDTLQLLMVGNSFCYYYVEELYGLLMSNPDPNRGYSNVEIVNVYYSGCSLSSHYKWWANDEAHYQVYRTNAKGRKELTPPAGYEAWRLEDALVLEQWDYMSLQGASSENNYSGATTEANVEKMIPLATPLLGRFHELHPTAQLLWHRTWAFEVGRISSGVAYTAEKLALYDAGMQNVCDWMCEEFDKDKPYDLKIVNSGVAWRLAREADALLETPLIPTEGGLCARLGVRNESTYPYYEGNKNAGDGYHDGDIGGAQFLNACAWYEVLTGQNVLDNPYKPTTTKGEFEVSGKYTLSDEFANLLRTAAHNAISPSEE